MPCRPIRTPQKRAAVLDVTADYFTGVVNAETSPEEAIELIQEELEDLYKGL